MKSTCSGKHISLEVKHNPREELDVSFVSGGTGGDKQNKWENKRKDTSDGILLSTFPPTLFFSLLLCSLSSGYANTEGFLHVAMAILGA